MDPNLLLHFSDPNNAEVTRRLERLQKKAISARKRRQTLKETHDLDVHKLSRMSSGLKSVDWTLSKEEIKHIVDCLIEVLDS
tara:strand:- start:3654 stop:3899 length:246 start_codon:yes stop_codon:yes gene_type:complete